MSAHSRHSLLLGFAAIVALGLLANCAELRQPYAPYHPPPPRETYCGECGYRTPGHAAMCPYRAGTARHRGEGTR